MRRAPLIVALVAGLALTGCGIPDNTEVERLRPGPSTGVSAGDDSAPTRNLRADTQDPAEFVLNYLEQAAGDFEGAADRVKEFLSPDAAVKFKASPDVKVIRLTESPLVEPGSDTVKIRVEEVGSLRDNGILVPGTGDLTTYELTVREIEGQQGLFVVNPPSVLLLSDEALNRFYRQRTIYFWNLDNTGLVPDLRYMSTSVPTEQEPTEIIDWLTDGPSPWLTNVVRGLPRGTKAIGNVPAVSDATLRITLSGQAASPPDDPVPLDLLQKQLRWSLRPNLPGTLELSVEQLGPKTYTGTDYLGSNAAYREGTEAERFVVYDGAIRRLVRSANSAQPVPVVAPEANKGVRTAAFSSSGSRWWAALVVGEAGGREALRVGAAVPGERGSLRRIALPAPIGRPVWAKSRVGVDDGTAGLVVAGGKLYRFAADGSSAAEVRWPGGPRTVDAVAVAPDGHRVAVLAGGKLFVAALSLTEDGPQVSDAQPVRTQLIGLTAVDWSSETALVVAGRRADSSRVAIMDVSIDGATQRIRLPDLGSNAVTYLAALPANPARGEETGAIAYMLGAPPGAYDEISPDRIGVDDLAERITDPPANVQPTAPFFLN